MGARLQRLHRLAESMRVGVLTTIAVWSSLAPCSSLADGAAPLLSVSERGVVIDAQGAGRFLLAWPALRRLDKDPSGERAVVQSSDQGRVVVVYPSGATLSVQASGPSAATYSLVDAPSGAASLILPMHVPISYRQGGRFALDHGREQPFPEQASKQLLAQGRASHVAFMHAGGAGLAVRVPSAYQQVQDNRVFGTAMFDWIYHHDLTGGASAASFTVAVDLISSRVAREPGALAQAPVVIMDRFGQRARKEFPGKVKSEQALRADVASQRAALPPAIAGRDRYGGLAGSGKRHGLQGTGYFRLARVAGRQVLLTPDGNLFFQLGVCGINVTDDFTTVAGRRGSYEWLPPRSGPLASAWREKSPDVVSFYIANWVRKFGKPFSLEEWTGQVVERLRGWGFNSGGAFSVQSATMRAQNFPFVATLPIDGKHGFKMTPQRVGAGEIMDPFATENGEALRRLLSGRSESSITDPLLIGYFLGNEQHFEQLRRLVPTFAGSGSPAKRALVAQLRTKYPSLAELNAAWRLATPLVSWEQAEEQPLFVVSEQAQQDASVFHRTYLDAYFRMITSALRAHDPNHLILGSRFTPATASDLDTVEISGRYLDVVSVNYYTYRVEPSFLESVHVRSGGRPLLLSEWYYGAVDQGLAPGVEVRTQGERAKAYRNYVEQSAALPFVVGTQWFIFNDQSLTGRFFEGLRGEGNNTGLVNVADRPYRELVRATRETGALIYELLLGERRPYVFRDARFLPRPEREAPLVSAEKLPRALRIDGRADDWPRGSAQLVAPTHVAEGNIDARFHGGFRLAWDEQHLFLWVHVRDPSARQNERSGERLWSGDAIELFIGAKELARPGSLTADDRQILIGAGATPTLHVAHHQAAVSDCQLAVTKQGDGYTVEAALTWSLLGVSAREGAELLFDLAIDNSDDGLVRRQQLVWSGNRRSSSDRGGWGRLKLAREGVSVHAGAAP